jgi:hypothetical protein
MYPRPFGLASSVTEHNEFLNFLIWMFFYHHSEFCSMVKRIYIYSYEEAKCLAPKAKLPDVGDTTKPNPNKPFPESDMPGSDLDNNALVADKD